MTLRDELVAAIRSWDLEIPANLRDGDRLITSGIFDSQAVFNLVLWVEAQTGSTIDPTSFDIVEAWNTIADVIAFVERRRAEARAAARVR